METENDKIVTEELTLFYGKRCVLKNVNLRIRHNKITAIIGPSGCGKSSLLRCLNRLIDLTPEAKVSGQVFLDGKDIYAEDVDVTDIRRRVGMVFQKPNPFPKSIYDNIAYGLRIKGVKS
ncbi:MAG: phosphate ABC transporter ATP-binding protein, partial [Planctomycetota bacterium]